MARELARVREELEDCRRALPSQWAELVELEDRERQPLRELAE